MFCDIYNNKSVLVTGHSGFKGSWLIYWLRKIGANVIGYSLEAPSHPNHFELLKTDIVNIKGDVRDLVSLNEVFSNYTPDIVFHLAAQSLVRQSYEEPVETYDTNVMGTLKVFEACRKSGSVKAIVNISSDKAYENKEQAGGYIESDPMGGYDPYSSSKGCSELLTSSYRNSFFNLKDFGTEHNTLLASCRAGNVIGGGDWGRDRLIPDIMTAAGRQQRANIRNPNATRPWQHVLESLSGYLLIGQKLLQKKMEYAHGWNFGPSEADSVPVEEAVNIAKQFWNRIDYKTNKSDDQKYEARLLSIDSSLARSELNWVNVWNLHETFEKTSNWYRSYYEDNRICTDTDLLSYINDAKYRGLQWAAS